CSISPFSAERPQDGLHRFSGFTMIAYQLRPESRGEIKLKSPGPFDAPAVHPNYLAAETDRRTIVAGLKLCRRILATPQMQSFIEAEFQPGSAVESDEELLDYARHSFKRSEEHTSELQSPYDLVCRLLLEKKKKTR